MRRRNMSNVGNVQAYAQAMAVLPIIHAHTDGHALAAVYPTE